VSLLPSLTESACLLDACDRLVGVDRYSDWPDSVQALPRLGGGLDPDLERLVKLAPDLVLAAGTSRLNQRLQQLGIPVFEREPQNLAQAREAFVALGERLGVVDAQARWAAIDRRLEQFIRSRPVPVKPPRVYVEVGGRGPYAAGAASFLGELLTRLGATHSIGPELGAFPLINPEWVLRHPPDLIILTHSEPVDLERRPGWAKLPAVKHQRICRLSPQEAALATRPGPRLPDVVAILARCLDQPA
jgi:iron complex transport system substrate-binding protein